MRNRVFNTFYILNIVFQGILTLLTPAALFFFISYLLVKRCSFPDWCYAIAIILGILTGLYSMVKFLISATGAFERIEREQNKKSEKGKRND